MTREEIINGLIHIAAGNWDETSMAAITEAITILESQPSLPEGLEEAAEEQARSFGYMSEDYEYKENVESFKAGARWIAEQGETKEQEVFEANPQDILSVPMVLSSVDTFNVGDKVIVQIRKKIIRK